MEYLSYTSEGRGHPFTDDVELNMCSHETRRNLLKVWDAERFSVPTRDVFQVEPDLADMTRKSGASTQCLEHTVDDANGDSSKSFPSVSTFTPYSSMEVGLGFSSPAVETGDEKLLQSGWEITNSEAPIKPKCNQSPVANSLLSFQEPSVSTQRARIANLQSQIQVCLVHGCKRDLSSLKEYHKRHKVCDIHSKTSAVIVNGIQQRFCQQCSSGVALGRTCCFLCRERCYLSAKFHILAEFDESKRSCRKRLADHNGRRRKPRLDTQLGSMLDLSRTSFHFSKTLAGGFFGQQCDEPPNHSKHVKLEMEPTQIPQSVAPLKFGPSLSIPLLHLPEMGKQYSPQTCLNSQPSVAELSTGSSSSCAFSLLSAQSHSSLTNSASISMDHPLILEGHHHADLTFNQISTKPLGKGTPENLAPVVFSSLSGEMEKRIPQSELSEESDGLNLKSYLYPEGVNTVDLFQLSLHLQRVEQQKCSSSAIPL